MAVYSYMAVDALETPKSGTLVADTAWEGRRRLRDQGLRVLSFEESSTKGRELFTRLYSKKRREIQVAELARHLALLLHAGVPLAEGLDVLTRQQSGRLIAVLKNVRDRIQGGASLADALAEHSGWFDMLAISAVRVGQISGKLDEALNDLAEHLRARQSLKGQLTAALTYPLILSVVGVAVVLFLMSYVVPQLLNVLIASGRALPRSTALLKGLSDFVIGYWWALALAAAGLIAAGIMLHRDARARKALQNAILGIPFIGSLLKKSIVAQFSQQMALLLKTGVPFVEAARTMAGLSKNLVLAGELSVIADAVESGSDIAPAMQNSRVFPPVVIHLVAVGQDSGELTALLTELKTRYEYETRLALQRLATALEPALIVVLAAVVGFVVFACMMPILETTRGIS